MEDNGEEKVDDVKRHKNKSMMMMHPALPSCPDGHTDQWPAERWSRFLSESQRELQPPREPWPSARRQVYETFRWHSISRCDYRDITYVTRTAGRWPNTENSIIKPATGVNSKAD